VETVLAHKQQLISLRQLYIHHDDGNFLASLIATHAALAGKKGEAVAVGVRYDL
jgi:hypothetical protein